MEIEAVEAIARARGDGSAFPDQASRRYAHRLIVPHVQPRFRVERSARCFTIGSCFSRNIEETLERWGAHLPTRGFESPRSEWPWRKNGLLNEYNPGSVAQRILSAVEGTPLAEETLLDTANGVLDLLLPSPSHAIGVTRTRALERRAQIADVYTSLARSELVVLTYGMIEAWYDRHARLYLNRKPPSAAIAREPGRFAFRVLSHDQVRDLMERAIEALRRAGVAHILIAVSPVPFNTTFSGRDAYTANCHSKSLLRACIDPLRRYPDVDYCPSYEMVTSGGPEVFEPDNMHVRGEVVALVIDALLSKYFTEGAEAAVDR